MKKPFIIVQANQKGGVGKTTTTREIGLYLADKGFKVLFIDADPQANLSKSLIDIPGFGLYEALTGGDYEPEEVKLNLSLLSGGVRLAGLEKSLVGELDAYTRLKELLDGELFQTYDFILIDSPPSLGVLTGNALTASNWLIIPMNPSLYSMQGANDLITTFSKVRKNFNPGLQLLGVLVNAYDSVPTITKQILAEIREAFGEKVFTSVLSKSIKIEEAIASKSGVTSKKGTRPSKIAEEIKAIGEEILLRLGV
jgi:chromosome partitioning protein